ncbi:hypothetical protein [Parachlamydia sp. AcF125]|uniref:hypothetical protein n=1 Tax=Parachlamydia sp. AcF125 TaxID=2795736 RepID=UPI001BC9E7AB|nr:hypothetical protein [Parachlamydia sp. AcF125]MBS4168602.1 hypothetical protein [Parachlamydia sp. AcF125]
MENSIYQVLNQASKTLESFIKSVAFKTSLSKEDFSLHLKETQKALKSLKDLGDYQVKAMQGSHPTFEEEIKNLRKLLTEIHQIKDKVTQEKVGAVQASLFQETIKDFQNLIKNLDKDHKRGDRVEKLDSLDSAE